MGKKMIDTKKALSHNLVETTPVAREYLDFIPMLMKKTESFIEAEVSLWQGNSKIKGYNDINAVFRMRLIIYPRLGTTASRAIKRG